MLVPPFALHVGGDDGDAMVGVTAPADVQRQRSVHWLTLPERAMGGTNGKPKPRIV